jgi:hypothetical protein
MYTNIYGCSESGMYSAADSFSPNRSAVHEYGFMPLPVCTKSEGFPILAAFMFISFVLVCAFVLISVMVAVVTAGIRIRIEKLQQNRDQHSSERDTLVSGDQERDEGEGVQHSFDQIFDPEVVLIMLKQVSVLCYVV